MWASRTDRADYSGPEFDTDRPWQYRSATGWGRPQKLHKYWKRARSKANRRAEIPLTQMRGYGVGRGYSGGRDNYKLFND